MGLKGIFINQVLIKWQLSVLGNANQCSSKWVQTPPSGTTRWTETSEKPVSNQSISCFSQNQLAHYEKNWIYRCSETDPHERTRPKSTRLVPVVETNKTRIYVIIRNQSEMFTHWFRMHRVKVWIVGNNWGMNCLVRIKFIKRQHVRICVCIRIHKPTRNIIRNPDIQNQREPRICLSDTNNTTERPALLEPSVSASVEDESDSMYWAD